MSEENYLDVPNDLKDLQEIDLSASKLSLGSEAQEKAREVIWQFADSEELDQERVDRYIDYFMEIINGER